MYLAKWPPIDLTLDKRGVLIRMRAAVEMR
jgi:hypothetical protein